jgi:hypothetical protein
VPLIRWRARRYLVRVFAFLDSGIRQSNHRNLIGVAPSGVDFYLYFKCFNTDYCDRARLRPNRGAQRRHA